jgi:NAD(P)H-dependent FMN reductase
VIIYYGKSKRIKLMIHITIISSSVRTGRNSHRVALFFKNYILEKELASVDILDLREYKFPLFDERLRLQKNPPDSVSEFADKIRSADGIIIVAPEYNGGYPASLKNVIDLLYEEWYRKPLAITTVSNGPYGGSQVLTSLLFTFWKIKAWVVPSTFPVPFIEQTFNEEGVLLNKPEMEKRAASFLKDLLWCINARKNMDRE